MKTTALVPFFFPLLVLCSIPANKTCTSSLSTIKDGVMQAVANEKLMGASLLRPHFHDRFVNSCDGSILLEDLATIIGEKTAGPNPNCAVRDSRDSIVELGGTSSTVVLGRRVSKTASLSAASSNIADPTSSLGTLISSFSANGLSTKNTVAHSEHEFDVFINHRGKDVKETIASLIFHKLQDKGRKVFLDKKSISVGSNIPESIEQAIYKSSVHIAIFSPRYADSEWCLIELDLISKTGAPIIPVFYEIRPSELRMEREDGVYHRAFQMHERFGKVTSTTLEQWKKALSDVSYIKGIIFKGDQGELLEQIANCVSEFMERRDPVVEADLLGR